MKNRFKVVVVGDGAVGKTCMLSTFAKGEFPAKYVPTVFENTLAKVGPIDGEMYDLNLWDTAGQEDFDRLRPLSYPDTHVILICFSIDSSISAGNVEEKWIEEVRHFCPGKPVLLIGLKSDLRKDSGTIERLEKMGQTLLAADFGDKLATKIGAVRYIECSALTRYNLEEVFRSCVNVALENKTKKSKCSLI